MWAIRRASIHLVNRGLCSGTTRIRCVKSEMATCYLKNYEAGIIEPQEKVLDALVYSRRFYKSSSSKAYEEIRNFSSHADAKSSEDQDDISELEALQDMHQEAAFEDGMDDESTSDSELCEGDSVSDDIQNESENIDTETDVGKKKALRTLALPAMAEAILSAPTSSANEVLGKWVEAGNKVTQEEVSATMLYLRKRGMYFNALQLSEWLETTEHFEFTERNFASHVDLIAKVRGIIKAEEYIHRIPESFRGELVYGSLLANWVFARNMKKSEEMFYKMKDLFPLGLFSCNQMLLLYKRTNRKKIVDILLLMEKENIKPSIFTYQILIDLKGQSNDISGMEQIIEKMKYEGVKPNMYIKICLARYYAANGLNDEADRILKIIEKGDITERRWVYSYLISIYASLGRYGEVGKIWKTCESNPRLSECMAAIEAWGQLNRIKDAEYVFEKMLEITKTPSPKHYAVMLNVYTNHNMIAEGKDLIVRMVNSGVTDLPVAWDALVRLYAKAGEVEVAESVLEKALRQRRARPIVTSFLTILDVYATSGDVHNAEKIFRKMRQVGYPAHIRSYRSLLYAYVNAKVPAYGFNERMRGDNVVPDKGFTSLLAQADEFGKSAAGELLA